MAKTVTIQAQQKWEVCCESRRTESSLVSTLNELGQHGWELVNVLHHKDPKGETAWTAFLKRPSAAQAPTAASQSSAALAVAPLTPTPPPKPAAEASQAIEGFDLSGDAFPLKGENS